MGSLAIFGGTFDPVHNGHVAVVQYVRTHFSHMPVLVSCAYCNPHKHAHSMEASAFQRLEMVRLAFQSLDGVEIDDVEVRTATVSYTVDMVLRIRTEYRALHGAFPKLSLILGSDALNGLARWKDVSELASMARLLIYPRTAEQTLEELRTTTATITNALGFQYTLLEDAPYLDISATAIRSTGRQKPNQKEDQKQVRRITAPMVPEAVYAYMQKHGLYGACYND